MAVGDTDDKRVSERGMRKRSAAACYVVIAALSFVLGVVCTFVASKMDGVNVGESSQALRHTDVPLLAAPNKTTLEEDELDSVVAIYELNDSICRITAREVLNQLTNADMMRDEDGNYSVPTSGSILSMVRNRVLAAEAAERGITVTDDDIMDYAEKMLGTRDIESIADSYYMDKDAVNDLLRTYELVHLLRAEIVGPEIATEPVAPNRVKGVGDDVPTVEYAKYIIEIVGDEWNAKTNDWADKDGLFATALSEYKIDKDGATYQAAQAAYYVARQTYVDATSEASDAWNSFCNELYSKVSVQLASIVT